MTQGHLHALVTSYVHSKTFLSGLAYTITALSILITFDQIRIIFVSQSSAGVSLLTWFFYFISSLVWLGYGSVRKDRVLVITSLAWVCANALVVSSIIAFS